MIFWESVVVCYHCIAPFIFEKSVCCTNIQDLHKRIKIMAQSFTAKNIHTKLNELSIDSLQDNFEISPKKEASGLSTTSLLSSRLAGEQYDGAITIPDNILIQARYTDEHPEPELLATSVGKELDGRMIPSSSTISLLSLNNNNFLSFNNDSYQSNKPSQFPPPLLDRKNSHPTLISSRNSITHSNQQRLQPYLKMSSPSIPANADFYSTTSPQVIPLSRNQSFQHITPDSPNLDPVSLGGSPSRFWLNSQTPPKSLSGSLTMSRTQMFPMTQLNSATQPQSQGFIIGSANSVSKAINIKGSGGDSPILNPVQTPIEDMPITPLYLNSEKNSYFVLTKEGSMGSRNTNDFKFRNDLNNDCLEEEDEAEGTEVEFLADHRHQSDINMD